MNWLWRMGLALATLGAIGGLIWYEQRGSEVASSPSPAAQVLKRGNYEQYLYSISQLSSENKKLAQFDPSLPAEESLLMDVLRRLASEGLATELKANVQPIVEPLNEANYITFNVGEQKLFFELFRNRGGEVGAVRFWKEPN